MILLYFIPSFGQAVDGHKGRSQLFSCTPTSGWNEVQTALFDAKIVSTC